METNDYGLSKRELVIIGLVSRGLSTSEIATRLGSLLQTSIDRYISEICRKLKVDGLENLIEFLKENPIEIRKPSKERYSHPETEIFNLNALTTR